MKTPKLWLTAALLGSSGWVNAFTLDFYCLSNNSLESCQIGESQLSAEVSETATSQVAFTFYNTGFEDSSISEVYFDDGTILGIATIIDSDNGGMAGVDFEAGSANPPNLPAGQMASPPFEVTAGFLADAANPESKNGVNPGEWLSIIFDLQSGQDINDIQDQLFSGALRVGLHVKAFENGESESFLNNAPIVPIPSSAIFLFSAVALLGFKKKFNLRKPQFS